MAVNDEITKLLGREFAPVDAVVNSTRPLAADDVRYYAIVDDLKAGVPYAAMVTKHRTARATIATIAKRENLLRQHSPGSEAHATYARDQRIRVLDVLFTKLEQLLRTVKTPKEFQCLVQAMGVLIEKRRLEDGETTNRTESNVLNGAKESLQAKIDLVAKRMKIPTPTLIEPELPTEPEFPHEPLDDEG